MASVAIMIEGAILNALAFTGGNRRAKYLSGVDEKAALEDKTRPDKALEAYQAAMAKYTRHRTKHLGPSKNKRSRTLRTVITLSNPITRHIQTGKSPAQKNLLRLLSAQQAAETGELLFVSGSVLILSASYAAFYFP